MRQGAMASRGGAAGAERQAGTRPPAARGPESGRLAELHESLGVSARVSQLRSLADGLGGNGKAVRLAAGPVVQRVKITGPLGMGLVELDDYDLAGLQTLRAEYEGLSSYQNPLDDELGRIDAAILERKMQAAMPQQQQHQQQSQHQHQQQHQQQQQQQQYPQKQKQQSASSSSSQSVVTKIFTSIGKGVSTVKQIGKRGFSNASSSASAPLKSQDKAHEETGKSLAASAATTIVSKGADVMTGGLFGYAVTGVKAAKGAAEANRLSALAGKAEALYRDSNNSNEGSRHRELAGALERVAELIEQKAFVSVLPLGEFLHDVSKGGELKSEKAIILSHAAEGDPLAIEAMQILGMQPENESTSSYGSSSKTKPLKS